MHQFCIPKCSSLAAQKAIEGWNMLQVRLGVSLHNFHLQPNVTVRNPCFELNMMFDLCANTAKVFCIGGVHAAFEHELPPRSWFPSRWPESRSCLIRIFPLKSIYYLLFTAQLPFPFLDWWKVWVVDSCCLPVPFPDLQMKVWSLNCTVQYITRRQAKCTHVPSALTQPETKRPLMTTWNPFMTIWMKPHVNYANTWHHRNSNWEDTWERTRKIWCAGMGNVHTEHHTDGH